MNHERNKHNTANKKDIVSKVIKLYLNFSNLFNFNLRLYKLLRTTTNTGRSEILVLVDHSEMISLQPINTTSFFLSFK